jgi:predicted lactoylglutathione lyase
MGPWGAGPPLESGTVRRMEQRVSLISLGVADLARSRAFYEQLGWRGQEAEETVFFQAGGQAVVLWGREKLAADAAIDDDGTSRFGGIVLAHNVATREEVDRVVSAAASAGGEVTKVPSETFYGGYAGFFRDLDGHVWEVAHNPGFRLDADGNLTLPDFGTATEHP